MGREKRIRRGGGRGEDLRRKGTEVEKRVEKRGRGRTRRGYVGGGGLGEDLRQFLKRKGSHLSVETPPEDPWLPHLHPSRRKAP